MALPAALVFQGSHLIAQTQASLSPVRCPRLPMTR